MDVTAADTAPDGAAALEQAMQQGETAAAAVPTAAGWLRPLGETAAGWLRPLGEVAAAATTAESVSGGEVLPKKKKKKLKARGGRQEGMMQHERQGAARAAQS